jgi:hypothetical protein
MLMVWEISIEGTLFASLCLILGGHVPCGGVASGF